MADKLSPEARAQALSDLSGWTETEDGGAIRKAYQFRDFAQAFAWMTKVAEVAEQMDHHPEWCNVYRDVSVTLRTHDAGGLTDLDISLAKRMDALATG